MGGPRVTSCRSCRVINVDSVDRQRHCRLWWVLGDDGSLHEGGEQRKARRGAGWTFPHVWQVSFWNDRTQVQKESPQTSVSDYVRNEEHVKAQAVQSSGWIREDRSECRKERRRSGWGVPRRISQTCFFSVIQTNDLSLKIPLIVISVNKLWSSDKGFVK